MIIQPAMQLAAGLAQFFRSLVIWPLLVYHMYKYPLIQAVDRYKIFFMLFNLLAYVVLLSPA